MVPRLTPCPLLFPSSPPPTPPKPHPPLQVTKADIEAEKARLAAIDARPIKKVAEAKARKAKRLQVGLAGDAAELSQETAAELSQQAAAAAGTEAMRMTC